MTAPDPRLEASRGLAETRARQSGVLSAIFYACTVLILVVAFVLADGRSWLPMILLGISIPFAVLTVFTGRASARWSAIAKEES